MTTINNSKAVTVIGLGMMGVTLARLLLQAGYAVTVWNRSAGKADELVKAGAVLAPDAAAAVAASPVTVICVYDYKATAAILRTKTVEAALQGRLLIQLTTGSPEEVRESEQWAHALGAGYVDGAIQAAPTQMGRADTPILVSGATAAYAAAEPVLRVFGGGISYLGDQVSAAAAMDLATLSVVYGTMLGFFHGARIMETEGVPVNVYGGIVAGIMPTFGDFVRHEGNVIGSGDFTITESPLRISVEAVERIAQHAHGAGLNTSFPDFANGLFKKAKAAGLMEQELAAIIKVLRAA